jgi:hypothetical protein
LEEVILLILLGAQACWNPSCTYTDTLESNTGLSGIQVKVFWIVMSCSVVVGYKRFRGPCFLHLHLTLKMEESWSSEMLVSYHNRRPQPVTSQLWKLQISPLSSTFIHSNVIFRSWNVAFTLGHKG